MKNTQNSDGEFLYTVHRYTELTTSKKKKWLTDIIYFSNSHVSFFQQLTQNIIR